MGASSFTVFRRVTAPIAMPRIATGAVFAFAMSLAEVVLTLFVAVPEQRTLARQMAFVDLREFSPAVSAAAFLLIVGTLALLPLVAKSHPDGGSLLFGTLLGCFGAGAVGVDATAAGR